MAPYSCKSLLILLFLYSLLHIVITTEASFNSTTNKCHDHERTALLHFKRSISLNKSASHGYLALSKTESWKVSGENTTDCCSWDGVECDDNTGYIIGLDLRRSSLYGFLHSNTTLFTLVHLQSLDLSLNDFRNSFIPPEISHLSSLTSLDLSFSVFSGPIPSELSRLFKLTALDLHINYLYGIIPASIGNLTQLTYLDLRANDITGGIPSGLTNMTQLSLMDLSRNNLTGPIPSSFSQLKNLESLDLSGNYLIGTVEVDIFLSLTKLTSLSLSFNKITLLTHQHINFTHPNLRVLNLNVCNLRKLPYFLKFQNNLELLFLTGNNIHGQIPHWIWNVSDHLEAINLSHNFLTSMEQNPTALPSKSLRIIDISDNMLQGNLPLPPPNTIEYVVSNNSLGGDIPPMICGGMSLKILDLSYNNMSGLVPQCLGNSSLAVLILQGNNFAGTIPETYPKECELKVMDLSQNQLIGKVPKSLSNCKSLRILNLSDNQMEQTFPIWLGTLPLLQVLLLHSNKFHGTMGSPRSPSEFPTLHIIDLSANSFTGDLPLEYIQIWKAMKIFRPDMEPYINTNVYFETQTSRWSGSFQSIITLTNKGVKTEYEKISNIFTAIDLSSNKFTGKIPESFGSLEGLQSLNLSNNELTGPIPRSLANLTQLEALDLSQNKLLGVIPEQLASQLNFLASFNVSCNLLSGRIPQGPQFKTFDNNSYMENSGLCGFPLSKNCGTVHSLPADGDEKDEDNFDDTDEFPSGFDWIFILAGAGSGLVVGLIMGNILTDRYSWLIGWIVHIFERRQKNQRRQIIRN